MLLQCERVVLKVQLHILNENTDGSSSSSSYPRVFRLEEVVGDHTEGMCHVLGEKRVRVHGDNFSTVPTDVVCSCH